MTASASIWRSIVLVVLEDSLIELESSVIRLQSGANELVRSLIVHI